MSIIPFEFISMFLLHSYALAIGEHGVDKLPILSPFMVHGSDGRDYDLANMTAGRPVLIVFFHAGLQGEKKTYRDMNRLSAMLQPKVRLIGLMRGDDDMVEDTIKKDGLKFLVLNEDHGGGLLGNIVPYTTSLDELYSALILPDGRLAHRWDGYNRHTLKEMEALVNQYTSTKLNLNVVTFPKKLTVGSRLMFDLAH